MKRFKSLSRIMFAIISLAIITALVPVSSPVCLAATASTVEFPLSGVEDVSAKVVFPNGEGVKYETGYAVPGVYSWQFVVIWVRPASSGQFQAKASITLNNKASDQWRLMFSTNMNDPATDIVKKDWATQPREYSLEWTNTPTKSKGCFYWVELMTPAGIQKTFFILLPLEQTVAPKQLDIYTLTLKHYAPFFTPPQGSGRRPGDVVATVTDKDTGEPVVGKRVWIYWKRGTDFDSIIEAAGPSSDTWWNEWSANYTKYQDAHNNSLIGYGNTDTKGEMVVSYYPMLGSAAGTFAADLKEKGQLNGKIWAVVVDGSTQAPEIYASVDVQFKGVAQIIAIRWHGDALEKTQANVKVETAYGDTVTVYDKQCPYDLRPGDKVKLVENDWVDIVWATGFKAKVTPKKGVLRTTPLPKEEGVIEIADERAQWWVSYCAAAKYFWVGLTLRLSTFAIGVCGLAKAAGAVGVVTVGAGATLLAKAGVVIGGIGLLLYIVTGAVDYWSDLQFDLYSNAALDYDEMKQERTIYLQEGGAVLYGEGGSQTEFISGHKITVSATGVQSPVSTFSKSDVSKELVSVLEEADLNSASVASGLTFESRSKPQGSDVQIPLTLSDVPDAIGNLDLNLSYDPSVLEATDVLKGGLCGGSIMESNITPGSVRIALADGNGLTGNGSVVYVKFKVIGAKGSSSPLDISSCSTNLADYSVLDLTTNDGVFKVVGSDELQGDCDGDGKLAAVDALCALQMAVGKKVEDLAMDVTGDGKVTSLDARKILQLAVQGG